MNLNRTLPPSLNKIGEIKKPSLQFDRLSNGLDLSYINIGSQELVKLQISLPAGIVHQHQSLLAFFTNKMLKEGSQNYSAASIAEKMDSYGAYYETRITRDAAYFNLFCLNKYLHEVLPLVAEMLLVPTFSEKEFSILRDQEKQSYEIRMQKVKNKAIKEFTYRIFGEHHPYGSFAKVLDYDQIDIEGLKTFHQKHYQLQHWRIYLSGYIDDKVKKVVDQYFGQIPLASSKASPLGREIPQANEKPELYHQLNKNAMQTALKLGCMSIARSHDDYPALSLTQTILGGYFGSRLMQNIREDKGYTYGIYSSIQHLRQASVFSIGSEVGAHVAQATIEEVNKELFQLRTTLVGEEELQLVKNYMSGSLLRSLNGPFALGEMMRMMDEFQLSEHYYADYLQAIQNTSAAQVMQMADKYLNEKQMMVVAIGGALQ